MHRCGEARTGDTYVCLSVCRLRPSVCRLRPLKAVGVSRPVVGVHTLRHGKVRWRRHTSLALAVSKQFTVAHPRTCSGSCGGVNNKTVFGGGRGGLGEWAQGTGGTGGVPEHLPKPVCAKSGTRSRQDKQGQPPSRWPGRGDGAVIFRTTRLLGYDWCFQEADPSTVPFVWVIRPHASPSLSVCFKKYVFLSTKKHVVRVSR